MGKNGWWVVPQGSPDAQQVVVPLLIVHIPELGECHSATKPPESGQNRQFIKSFFGIPSKILLSQAKTTVDGLKGNPDVGIDGNQ